MLPSICTRHLRQDMRCAPLVPSPTLGMLTLCRNKRGGGNRRSESAKRRRGASSWLNQGPLSTDDTLPASDEPESKDDLNHLSETEVRCCWSCAPICSQCTPSFDTT